MYLIMVQKLTTGRKYLRKKYNFLILRLLNLTNHANMINNIDIIKTKGLICILTVSAFLFTWNPTSAQPNIFSFAPISGVVGDTITLTGINFNTHPDSNIVFFGATRANVCEAIATSLKVKVPIGATYGPITVLNTATALTACSKKFFNPTFIPSKDSITRGDIAYKVDFTTFAQPNSVVIGDIDGDGKSDLAIANRGGNTVSVLRNTSNTGMISFANKVDFTTMAKPWYIAIGDIDGDGKPDLVIIDTDSNLSVLRNTSNVGAISFATKVDFITGLDPQSVAIGDLDQDGRLDLAIANEGSNTVSILRNTGSIGTISFATKVDFTTGTDPMAVAIGDLDEDGKPDLAVVNNFSFRVSVLRNISSIGTISFASKLDYTTGSYPRSIALGDLNGDGKLDMAIANNNSRSVSIFRNTSVIGTISFTAKVDIPTERAPVFLAIGNIDGDSRPDLAVITFAHAVSVFRNTGNTSTISFAKQVDFETGTTPRSVAIGDIDGDGRSDLTANNIVGNSISVLRNNPGRITVTGSLADFTACIGTFSDQQSFNVSGSGLAEDLVITAPYGFEISKNSGTGFVDSISLPLSSGIINNTTLFIRTNDKAMPGSPIVHLNFNSGSTNYKLYLNPVIYRYPKVGFWINNDSQCLNNNSFLFTNTSTYDFGILSSKWDFGSGNNDTSTRYSPIKTYTNANTYLVKLVVTSDGNCKDSLSKVVTVKPISISTTNISICPNELPYTWNGRNYTTSKIDTIFFTNEFGCDSLFVLNLTVKPSSSSTNKLSICQTELPYIWNGLTFNEAGTQTKSGLINSVGCDSAATLNLIINPTPNTSIINGSTEVARLDTSSYYVTKTTGSIFNWNVTSGTIDSGIGTNTIRIKWNTIGIDTLKVTEISDKGCTGVQKLLPISIGPAVGLNETNINNNVITYPNPFNETIHITLLNNIIFDKAVIYDLSGKEIITTYNNEIDLSNLKSGIYLIRILDKEGNTYSQKISKN